VYARARLEDAAAPAVDIAGEPADSQRVALLRPETPADAAAVRAVHDAAFGRPEEGRVVEALRTGARPYVGLVAVEDGEVIGHVAFSPATLYCYNATYPIMALGPMAVRPDRQRRGIGSALVREGLDACRRLGHLVIAVLGHPGFYPRFGFAPARPMGVMCEYPVPDEVFMLAELAPGALRGRRGVVQYAPAFRLATE
jgi:putative acetyltransferase